MCILVLASAASAPGSAEAAFPGQNGKIAFQCFSPTGPLFRICVMSSDGSGVTILTSFESSYPTWSPDGRRIAFHGCGGTCGVYVMNADGSGLGLVTADGTADGSGSLAWSPDGQRLAFVRRPPLSCASGEGGAADIFSVGVDGKRLRRLTFDETTNDTAPAWSPDGNKIAFRSGDFFQDEDGCFTLSPRIHVMNPDGSGQTPLSAGGDNNPNWSPDGQKIVFDRFTGPTRIWVMNADGSQPTDLNVGGEAPAWSPNGQKIVFGQFSTITGRRIHVMNPDGTAVTNLNVEGEDPDWQPIPHQSDPAPPYDHPRLASPLRFSLVPVHRPTLSSSQCQARGGTPSTHGAPLSFSSCNPPAYRPGTVARLGPQAEGSASVAAIYGDTNPANGDGANLTIRASLTDVQTQAGADYAPNPSGPDATLVAAFRLSDTYNGPSQSDPATSRNFDFGVPVDCAPSAGPEGSTCATDTSADALTPGAIRENESMVLQVLRLRVDDSGLNVVRGDADDRIFAAHGLYVP